MYNILRIIFLFSLIFPVSACGLKGKLKTPEQIQKIEAKKAQEEIKKQEKNEEEDKQEDQSAYGSVPSKTQNAPTPPLPAGKE